MVDQHYSQLRSRFETEIPFHERQKNKLVVTPTVLGSLNKRENMERAGEFACYVLGYCTCGMSAFFRWQTGGRVEQCTRRSGSVLLKSSCQSVRSYA